VSSYAAASRTWSRDLVSTPMHQHVQPTKLDYHAANWSLLLPSPLTVSSCYSYSNSDMPTGNRMAWPFTCSCTVSSVFWRHHFKSRSGRPRDHCCLVALIQYLTDWIFCEDVGKGGPALRGRNVLFNDALRDRSVCRCDRRIFIIIIIIIINEVVLFNTVRWRQAASQQQQSAAHNELLLSLAAHPYRNTILTALTRHQFIHNEVNRTSNMIYVKLLSVSLTATVTSSRSHHGKGLAGDFIKQYERGEVTTLEIVSKVSYRYIQKTIICETTTQKLL
jgi:hypothetical protein